MLYNFEVFFLNSKRDYNVTDWHSLACVPTVRQREKTNKYNPISDIEKMKWGLIVSLDSIRTSHTYSPIMHRNLHFSRNSAAHHSLTLILFTPIWKKQLEKYLRVVAKRENQRKYYLFNLHEANVNVSFGRENTYVLLHANREIVRCCELMYGTWCRLNVELKRFQIVPMDFVFRSSRLATNRQVHLAVGRLICSTIT